MAWSHRQSASAGVTTGTTCGTPYGTTLITGSKLLAVVSASGVSCSGVADGHSNNFTEIAVIAEAATVVDGELSLWVLDTPAGDVGLTPTITATFGTSCNGAAILIQEVTGLAAGTTASQDGTWGSLSGTGNLSSPTYASGAANEYLVSIYGDNGWNLSPTPAGSGWTTDANDVVNTGLTGEIVFAWKNSSGGSETGGFTGATSAQDATFLGAFLLPSVASPPVRPALPGRTWQRRFRHPQQFPQASPSAPVVSPAAGVAVVNAVAPQPSVASTAGPAVAAVAAVAPAPSTAVTVSAGVAAVAAVAPAPSVSATAQPPAAVVAVVALAPSTAVTVTSAVAIVNAVAPAATVSTVPAVNANAAVAAVSAVAPAPSVASTATAAVAVVNAVAPAASAATAAQPGVATAKAVALAPSTAVTVTSAVAIVNAVAPAATVTVSGNTNANAGVAAVAATSVRPVASPAANTAAAAVTAVTPAVIAALGAQAGAAAVQAAGLAVPAKFTVGQLGSRTAALASIRTGQAAG